MSCSLDRAAILDALQALDRLDRGRSIFGSIGHHYKLNPPLAQTVVKEFEREHKINLPEDYRYFITEIGNGGAGPYYGLFPFGMQDDGHGVSKWDGKCLVGDVSADFPHSTAWNPAETFWQKRPHIPSDVSPTEEERLWEEWDQALEEQYWNPRIMNGAFPICHRGCALRQWLVVQGPRRDTVWGDNRADETGIKPVLDRTGQHLRFADWYLSWLAEATAQGRAIWPKQD
jgi:hypothetical protein